jgi:hypothetical protein
MSTKKIQYNPNILSSMKTKTKTQKINRPLLINQNSLKNQLISRIKNHKQNEQKEIKEKKEKEVKNKLNEIIINNKESNSMSFADEFNDSINYLSQLSKKHKTVEQNLNKTIRQKHDLIDPNQVYVDVELPQELKEVITPEVNLLPLNTLPKKNYILDNQLPYGCLKNGVKPTYRQFTRRNLPVLPVLPELTEREKKLNMLKGQYKVGSSPMPAPMQMQEVQMQEVQMQEVQMQEQPYIFDDSLLEEQIFSTQPDPILSVSPTLPTIIVAEPEPEPIPRPKLIKKTIRRKYTLGKSNIYRKVSVLIKNNETRKKVIVAQKELKKKSIHEIKKFLKDRFLLKSGSSAPNEVLRKMYESVMLTGQVTNNNKDTMLHNFINDTK